MPNEKPILKKFEASSYASIAANMSKLITKDKFEDREHYVVPTVLIVEGVLNGILYKAEDLQKFPDSWNGIPVPVLHTYDEISGQAISANKPKLVEKQSVGRLWNVKYEDRRLKGEIWIDIEKCNKIAPHVLRMLENNQHIEVSTALFTEDELVQGTFNGKTYTAIAHNFRPDHLAILPNEKGACGWEDGAGMPRINKEKDIDRLKTLTEQLAQLQGFQILDSKQVPGEQGDMKEPQKGEKVMDRTKSIEALIANGAWSEDDKDFLTALEVDQFEKIEKLSLDREVDLLKEDSNSEPKEDEPKDEKKPEPEADDAEDEPKDNKDDKEGKEDITVEDFLANAPEAIKTVLEAGLKEHADKKARLISDIKANKRNPFTDTELEVKSVEELSKLKDFAGSSKDYSAQSGAGKPKSNKEANPSGIVPMPTIDWDKTI